MKFVTDGYNFCVVNTKNNTRTFWYSLMMLRYDFLFTFNISGAPTSKDDIREILIPEVQGTTELSELIPEFFI